MWLHLQIVKWSFIGYYGGEKRISCEQAAVSSSSGYLWVRCCGLAPAAEEVDVRQSCWDLTEVPLVRELSAGAVSLRKSHSSSGTCSVFVLPGAWPPQCWWYQDLRMPFSLSWDSDLKGVGTYYISHLLMHATYNNIFKCLSWWMNNFHYLALVFSSGWSSIFKLFQWFAVCSSGVVFWLDVFLLWCVAPFQSSPICLFRDTWTVPSVAARHSLCAVPKHGGHSHCIPQGLKELSVV